MGLLHNRKFIRAILWMAALLIVIFAGEIWTSRYREPTTLVSDIAAVACASTAAVMYIAAWRKMSSQEVSKRVWGLVTLGIVLWAVAEGIWGFYEQVLKIEIPYPSVADLFWFAGYAPIYLALIIRYRSFHSTASALQRRIVLLFMLAYSAVMFIYVVKPMLEAFDASRLAESLTNIGYPLADWGLCVLTLVIIFSLERGRFARVWHLFGTGIILTTTADLLFSYASWNEIYYPGGQLNFISGLLDGVFNVSYLMLGLAVYAYTLLSEALPPAEINLVLKSLARMDVLVFVNPEGHILSVSDNFMNLTHAPATKPYIGLDLAQALGIEGPRAAELLGRIVEKGSLRNYPLSVKGVNGETKSAWLSSLVILNEEAKLDSIALVLRTDPPPAGEVEIPLHEDQRMLIDYYLGKSGARELEEDEVIRAYFIAQLNLLYSIIEQYGGAKMAEKLLEDMSQNARLNNWQITREGQNFSIPEDFAGQSLRDLLQPLLEQARDFTTDMTDQRMVEQEMMSVEKNATPETLRILDKYGLRAGPRKALKARPLESVPA